MKNDCYINWKEIDGVEAITVKCVNCYAKNKEGILWPQVWGYGETSINCCECGEVIYSGRTKTSKETSKSKNKVSKTAV